MQIGFTSTSFRQIKSLDKIVQIAVDSGVDCIEWGGDIHIKNVDSAKYAKNYVTIITSEFLHTEAITV